MYKAHPYQHVSLQGADYSQIVKVKSTTPMEQLRATMEADQLEAHLDYVPDEDQYLTSLRERAELPHASTWLRGGPFDGELVIHAMGRPGVMIYSTLDALADRGDSHRLKLTAFSHIYAMRRAASARWLIEQVTDEDLTMDLVSKVSNMVEGVKELRPEVVVEAVRNLERGEGGMALIEGLNWGKLSSPSKILPPGRIAHELPIDWQGSVYVDRSYVPGEEYVASMEFDYGGSHVIRGITAYDFLSPTVISEYRRDDGVERAIEKTWAAKEAER